MEMNRSACLYLCSKTNTILMHYTFLMISWKAQEIQFRKYLKRLALKVMGSYATDYFREKFISWNLGQFYKHSKEKETTHVFCASPALMNNCIESTEIFS